MQEQLPEMCRVPNLTPSAETELQNLAKRIVDQYELGNKSSARAMMNNVTHSRKAYVAMWVYIHAHQRGVSGKAYSLICSVTK